jgi:uncharacterized MAPEG superfamily protein
MQNCSAIALVGFITWTLFLLVLMEVIRVRLVVTDKVGPCDFRPDNANLSPFMQRLARAHANCIESLPVFGGLLLVALVTNQAALTDPLALVLLGARLVQSTAHLTSLSARAINLRFAAFAVQVLIAVYWACRLMWGVIG